MTILVRDAVPDPIFRELLPALGMVPILHRTVEGPAFGLWLLRELERHGYRISPGIPYPILARLERNCWLRVPSRGAAKARRTCRLTAAGRALPLTVRDRLGELHDEVERTPRPARPACRREPR